MPADMGNYGTDYGVRAVIALMGLAANLPQDSMYPTTFVDASGRTLTGRDRYVLHFDKGHLPPVNAFWSVTMYDAESFFVDNSINRYNLAGWMPLVYNADGSLDLYLQKDSPGTDKEANWLPAPAGEFNVTMRMYWPKTPALSGAWQPPACTGPSSCKRHASTGRQPPFSGLGNVPNALGEGGARGTREVGRQRVGVKVAGGAYPGVFRRRFFFALQTSKTPLFSAVLQSGSNQHTIRTRSGMGQDAIRIRSGCGQEFPPPGGLCTSAWQRAGSAERKKMNNEQ